MLFWANSNNYGSNLWFILENIFTISKSISISLYKRFLCMIFLRHCLDSTVSAHIGLFFGSFWSVTLSDSSALWVTCVAVGPGQEAFPKSDVLPAHGKTSSCRDGVSSGFLCQGAVGLSVWRGGKAIVHEDGKGPGGGGTYQNIWQTSGLWNGSPAWRLCRRPPAARGIVWGLRAQSRPIRGKPVCVNTM